MTAADHDETPPRWGMPDALICFLVGFLVANIAVAIVAVGGADVDSLAISIAGLVGLWIGLVAAMAWVSRTKGSGSFATDFGLRFERARDLVGIPVGIGTQLILIPLLYLPISRFIEDLADRLEEPTRELTDTAGDSGLIVLAVLVIVGAPIVEELFYRGLLLRAVERRFGTTPAIVISGLAFGVAHFEPIQFPALAAFGVILAFLAVRYGRLGPGIFAHAAFNAVTMAVLIATN